MNKKILSLILTVAMVLSLFSVTAFAADEITHTCNSSAGDYCLVCDVAAKINALPAADKITIENAAAVTEQIHAIDRLKVELDYDGTEYEELLTMVESGNDGSGFGTDVPLRYMNAVKAVQQLGGNSLYAMKKFVASDGSAVNVDNAEIKLEVTNVDTNESQTLTMTTMDAIPGTLCADADFYSANDSGDGWTYKYILPAGTYRIKEVSDSGATVGGMEFVTTEVAYNGTVSTEGIIVTLAAGAEDEVNIGMTNVHKPTHGVEAIDESGNPVTGVSMSIQGVTEQDFSHTWTTDGQETYLSLIGNREYTLTVNSVPSGYAMPEPASVTFAVGDGSAFTGPFALTVPYPGGYTVNVTIPAAGVEAKFKTMAHAGYYAETSESEEKTGVIAMNAQILNLADIADYIVGYGMFIYRGSILTDIDITNADSTDVNQLKADDGKYHAIVKNITGTDFETEFSGRPFVIASISGTTKLLTGDNISAKVADYSWLGAENPYSN